MIVSFPKDQLAQAGPDDLSDALERGNLVQFPECPIELPPAADLDFLRNRMPELLASKNISYHPEADRIIGIKGAAEEVGRAQAILKTHGGRVQSFLRRVMSNMTRDWQVGTSSFRPLQERGR